MKLAGNLKIDRSVIAFAGSEQKISLSQLTFSD